MSIVMDALRCPLCDEIYDPSGDRAKVHEHPEPQSGRLRELWLESGLSYEQWVEKTEAGRAWKARTPQ